MENQQQKNIEIETLEELELIRANNRPLVINRSYFKITNNHNSAVVLSHLFYCYSSFGYQEFYKTNDELQDECCLSRTEFENARKKLIEANLITFEKRGLPCKLYYTVNIQLLVMLHKNLRKEAAHLRMQETCILESGKLASIECRKPASIECRFPASTINNMNTHEYNMNKKYIKSEIQEKEIEEIFMCWRDNVPDRKNCTLTKPRLDAIKSRLKEGRTAEEIKQAIINCAHSKFHNGNNKDGNLYNDLTLICRKDKFDSFLESVGKGTKNMALSPEQTGEMLRREGFTVT